MASSTIKAHSTATRQLCARRPGVGCKSCQTSRARPDTPVLAVAIAMNNGGGRGTHAHQVLGRGIQTDTHRKALRYPYPVHGFLNIGQAARQIDLLLAADAPTNFLYLARELARRIGH